MNEDRNVLEFLFSTLQQSPHQRDFTRRHFVQLTARLGLSAGIAASLYRTLGTPLALAAEAPSLPEITSIPEKLKGSGVVRVCSYAGASQEAQR